MICSDVRAIPSSHSGASSEDVTSNVNLINHAVDSINGHVSEKGSQGRTSDFAAWTFPDNFSLIRSSGASFTASIPEDESEENDGASTVIAWHKSITQEQRECLSRRANVEASKLVAARETRIKERLVQDDRTGTRIRLAAGSVPILRDGRVILIGSRKGNTWVGLPKGGWESDESLEEAAIRETFEEAGVLGILGSPLPSFLVESGKGKSKGSEAGRTISNTDIPSPRDGGDSASGVNFCELNAFTPLWNTASNGDRSPGDSIFPEVHSHKHTCMTFFPLYVLEVMDTWPESSRSRNAYPIEEAVRLVRPELRWVLEHIQRKSLHQRNGSDSR